MKVIIYTSPDGRLAVCRPSEGVRLAIRVTLADGTVLKPAGERTRQPVDSFLRQWPVTGAVAEWAETEAEFVARIRAKDVPSDATNVQIVDESAIPTDRTFRDAWKPGVGCVDCDITTAKGITRDMLRAERAERFKNLDGEWMRAMGRGETPLAANTEAKRETLRNWPQDPRIDACASADELKGCIQKMKAETA